MTGTVIDEVADAVAASLCLAARDRDGVTRRHPRRCTWCRWPMADLLSMVEGFNAWAGYDDRRGTYSRHDARVFQGLPKAQQAQLIRDAQGLEEEVPW